MIIIDDSNIRIQIRPWNRVKSVSYSNKNKLKYNQTENNIVSAKLVQELWDVAYMLSLSCGIWVIGEIVRIKVQKLSME